MIKVCRYFVLYPPETNERKPIVIAHGLGGIKEIRLDAFANEFCNAGYACLLVYYRYFGYSEGEPRHLLDIDSQIKGKLLLHMLGTLRN